MPHNNKEKPYKTNQNKSSSYSSPYEVEKTNSDFGIRCKAQREKLGLTQQALSEKIGASKSSIQLYEKGSIPRGDYLVALARVFGVSIDYLLTGVEQSGDEREIKEKAGEAYGVGDSMLQRVTSDEWALLWRALHVVQSGTLYADALKQNINAFHEAVEMAEKQVPEEVSACPPAPEAREKAG